MSELTTTINTIVQLRRGTAAQWDAVKSTFIPAAGEACITLDGAYAGQVKFGNGTDNWGTLHYAGMVSVDGTSIQSVNGVLSIPGYAAAVAGQMLKKGTNGLEWITLTPESIGAVPSEISNSGNKAIIFNEADGGGAKFEHSDGTESFVGVNNGGENGLMAQIYADKWDETNEKWIGSRINVYHDKIYYQSKQDTIDGIAKNDPSNEIATKGDITALTGVLQFLGVATQFDTDTVDDAIQRFLTNKSHTPQSGDVIIVDSVGSTKEFVYDGTRWIEFGDENRYATHSQLSDESYARSDADDALQANIDAEETARIAADNTKVDKEVSSSTGKALIFNEADGGGAKFEANDGTASFVGVNSDTNGGIGAQLYDINVSTKKGSKLDVTKGGIYYTKGDDSANAASLRDVEDNELVTKKDISSISTLINKTQNLTGTGTLSTDYLTQGSNKFIIDGGSASI